MIQLAHAVLRQQSEAFLAHVGKAEGVHDARVATRRLRAALRVFEDVLPPETLAVSTDLRWMANQLGPVRDLEVQLARSRAIATELGLEQQLDPYTRWLAERRRQAIEALDRALEAPRFAVLTDHLRPLALFTSDDDAEAGGEAAQRLRGAYRRLRKRADALGQRSPSDAFHRVRIRAKRLRYAAEFFEPLYGRAARRVARRAVDVQDLLGDHQDGVVNTLHVHEAVRSPEAAGWAVETSLALGQVVQWEAQHGARLRRQFPARYRKLRAAWRDLRAAF